MNSKQRSLLLLFLLILSSVCIILIKLILKEIPEVFEIGHELGEIFYDLSLAYIAAYLFYQIVVASPKRRDLKNIYSAVKWMSFDIVYRGSSIINPRSSLPGPYYTPSVNDKLTEQDFITFCEKNKMTDNYTVYWTNELFDFITYASHFKGTQEKVLNKIEDTFQFHSHLETEHIKILNDIKSCPFMTLGSHYINDLELGKDRPNLMHMEYVLYDFYQETMKLHRYMKKFNV